jgi:hypothetical protein
VAREKSVCAELEKPAKMAWWRSRPEGEFLHEVRTARAEKAGERELKFGEGSRGGKSGESSMIPSVYRGVLAA